MCDEQCERDAASRATVMDDFKLPTQEDMAAYVQQAQQTLEELKPAMLAWISLLCVLGRS